MNSLYLIAASVFMSNEFVPLLSSTWLTNYTQTRVILRCVQKLAEIIRQRCISDRLAIFGRPNFYKYVVTASLKAYTLRRR